MILETTVVISWLLLMLFGLRKVLDQEDPPFTRMQEAEEKLAKAVLEASEKNTEEELLD